MAARRDLPYETIGAAVPVPAGWLVLPGRLMSATVLAEDAFVERNFADVLDHRPAFSSLAVGAPLAFPDHPVPGGRRQAEKEAAADLGWPRRVALERVPSRAAVMAPTFEAAQALEPWLTRLAYRRFRQLREVEREIQLYHQRKVFAASAELTYLMLNGDAPLEHSRHVVEGQRERLRLIEDRIPGITLAVNSARIRGAGFRHLVDAAALLWTARRISGRVLARLPVDPEWNDSGLRMEFVR
jgi:predicted RNase H-like nuclease